MHSRATDRRSASKCQGKCPDQTLDRAFGLPEVLVAFSTSRLSCKSAGKTRTLMPVWDSSGESRLRRVRMSDSSQIALIRKLYGARGNVNVFKSLLADDLEYDIAEGFPNGGVYRGIDTVVNDFFAFFADFDEFYAEGDEYFESGDHVIVLGRYFGLTKKGRRVQSRFAHFWTLRDGKVGRLQQTADTLLIARALEKK